MKWVCDTEASKAAINLNLRKIMKEMTDTKGNKGMKIEISQTEEMIAVMQASIEGAKIQCRKRNDEENIGWHEPDVVFWNWAYLEYRVKPEPIERWMNMYADGAEEYFDTEDEARERDCPPVNRLAVHMREVIEE